MLPDPLDEDAQSILESHCSRIWAAEKKKINEGDEKGDDEEEKKRNDRKEENNSKFFKRSPVAPIQKLPHMQALTHLTTPTPQLFSLNRQNVPPSDPAHLSYSNQNQTDVPHQSARISNSIRHRVFTTEDQQGLTTMQYVPEMIASSPCVGKMMPNLVTTSAVADELRPHTKRMPLDSLIHPPPLSTTCAGACTTEASQCFLPAAVKECTRGPDGNFQPDFCNFTIRSTDSNMAVTSASCMTTSATASTHSEQLTTYYRHQVPHLSNITFKQRSL
ncbi:unnamed protein product [Protopolystoma xenopodis]|uniref:Axin beta-catenin binding domain-containing protein n=1 Tax=Protopolystoma xenopodis TaxID=117903 RepID=A0A448WJI7_9PLAT|nr:unnamed protein product [Protopolystoma xenopodis]